MDYLVDTNLLVRLCDKTASLHVVALNAIDALFRRGDSLYLTAQKLIEFWAVATRPVEANGLGWSPEDTFRRVEQLKSQFLFIEDSEAIFSTWLALASARGIQGKKVYDARLVAVMLINGIRHLLTFNVDDFRSFPDIAAVLPQAILAVSS